MRKITVQVLLGAALIAAMCLGAPTAAFVGEITTKEETAELQDAKEDDSKKKDSKDAAGQDLVITIMDNQIQKTVNFRTGRGNYIKYTAKSPGSFYIKRVAGKMSAE